VADMSIPNPGYWLLVAVIAYCGVTVLLIGAM
jgi:hypothetical protein